MQQEHHWFNLEAKLNPRFISNLSILSYHVKPQDLLQSLPLKWIIILPLPFILYVLKHPILE